MGGIDLTNVRNPVWQRDELILVNIPVKETSLSGGWFQPFRTEVSMILERNQLAFIYD